ncbi:MAG TPA: sodium:glutamate symporter, partial [Spirochaetia bacterium]|nr:sodium:glutamate symporter [Spirochaetia bacterium]
MDFDWTFFIDVGLIGLALLFATFLRAKIRFFQRFLIPNALTAGFILLPVYNFVLPAIGLGVNGLGELVYHLLNISFIAMTLRKSPPKANKGSGSIFATSVAILSQYAIQALTGLLLTFLFIKTIAPGLFPAFGFDLPLGFALGPGQAFAIGQ